MEVGQLSGMSTVDSPDLIDSFTYLGSTLSQVIHDEVNTRIARASAAFWKTTLQCMGKERNTSVD